MNVTGDVMARDSQASAGYWEIVQDSLADLVRIMLSRCFDEKNHPALVQHCRSLRGEMWVCAFPNLFLTIAPAEWKFPMPYFLEPYVRFYICGGAYIMALHMFYLVRSMWRFLANRFGHRYFIVYEWVVKTEYQGRRTPHWHIAAWVLCYGLLQSLVGRTGTAVVSAFVRLIAKLFACEVDVQVGNGRLNYINGYVAKDHDAVDVGMGEYVQKGATAPWLATYRLLSKSTPGIPEVAIRMAQLAEFERSYTHVLLYPPQPEAVVELAGRRGNFSTRMYGFYSQEMRTGLEGGVPIEHCFLHWHRPRQYNPESESCEFRGQHGQRSHGLTMVVACRFWYELTDGYLGQFNITMLPHREATDILPRPSTRHLDCMKNFVGALDYLTAWRHGADGVIQTDTGVRFKASALPIVVDERGRLRELTPTAEGDPVFENSYQAHRYLLGSLRRDLQYRGYRDERVTCFELRHEALHLLHERVERATDEHVYRRLRQEWDSLTRPQRAEKTWSPEQQNVFKIIARGIGMDDEELRVFSKPFLYIGGDPGSGKTAVLLEAALRACARAVVVLIICPTGFLVHKYKALLPEMDGVENIRVDTIQGVLKYKRPGADGQVRWTPPSALRKIDLILCDEASQFEDDDWNRLFQCIREQPHKPFTALAADFQQLQPVKDGGECENFCMQMETVRLGTVYRSKDAEHLLFLNRIRTKQPDRQLIEEYFDDRHW